MISVVVVTYRSGDCVDRCIASLREYLPGAEIVVVDNASGDETVELVRSAAPESRLVENAENVGFGRACNIGAEAARGTHLLFLNPDVEVTGVDEVRLERLLSERPFGLAAPAFEGEEGRRRPEYSWASELLTHTVGTLRPREWRPRTSLDHGGDTAWVAGGMLLASRDEFLALGGFDPRFFLYYEDRDLSRRYRVADLPIRTTEALRGRHSQGTSSRLEGTRAFPLAWSLLGWIEYVWIHEGERRAGRAARLSLAMLRLQRLAVGALAAPGWQRARRKARQLDELLGFLAGEAASADNRFCPDARRLIRELG